MTDESIIVVSMYFLDTKRKSLKHPRFKYTTIKMQTRMKKSFSVYEEIENIPDDLYRKNVIDYCRIGDLPIRRRSI